MGCINAVAANLSYLKSMLGIVSLINQSLPKKAESCAINPVSHSIRRSNKMLELARRFVTRG